MTPIHIIRTNIKSVKGLTLVELMVALALSSVLILGVITVYFDARSTDKIGNALARIQETGRFSIDFLAKDIRMAGYQGCIDPETLQVNIIANNPPTTSLFQSALRGFEVDDRNWADGLEFDGTTIETQAKLNTSVISIQRASTTDTELTGNMRANNANVQITTNSAGFQQGDVVIIADCENADMFRISSTPNENDSNGNSHITLAHANNVNTDNKLSTLYDESANVMSFQSLTYYVGDTGRTNTQGDTIYALYRQVDQLNNSASRTFDIQELVEGVDSMKVTYGERLATGNLRYVPVEDVTEMANVESIRLGLLIASNDYALPSPDNQTYELPGLTISPEGTAGATETHEINTRVRRVFTSTINLRNRQ